MWSMDGLLKKYFVREKHDVIEFGISKNMKKIDGNLYFY